MALKDHLTTVSPLTVVLFATLLAAVLNVIYYQRTTARRRRDLIKQHGCKPAYQYPHKGITGKFFGLDAIGDMVAAAKRGEMLEFARRRNFGTGHKTLKMRSLRNDIIMTIEPENVKTVLATRFPDYDLGSTRRDSFVPLFGHGIFATDGARWERSRALIRPNFVRQQVADVDMFETHVSHMINNIPKDGSTIDLQEQFFGLTMDSATEFLFGKSTNSLVNGGGIRERNFVKAYTYATDHVSKSFRTAGLNNWIPDSRYRSSVKTIHSFADEIIAEALQRRRQQLDLEKQPVPPTPLTPTGTGKSHTRYTFLSELISMTQDPYTLRSELLNVLLAGRDTTAGLLSNTWHVLSTRPDIWAKLKAEVDTLNGEKPDYPKIKEMKYLRWLLNESLRLMPVVPGNSRQAIRDTVLPLGGGEDGKSPVLIKKGQVVAYSPWSMHRRVDYYGEDALEFKPERWESLRPGWEYLPFNGGPRICIGQQYALLEAGYTTVRLVQAFKRCESRGEVWREGLSITLYAGSGCWVGLSEEGE